MLKWRSLFMEKTKVKISPVDIGARKALDLRAGDTVRVNQKIVEGGKTRLQAFEGLVLARKHGTEPGATFTVRRVASGVGVEKIFPLYSPMVDSIEVLRRAKVRRAKLYHVRDKVAKEIRRQIRNTLVVSQKGSASDTKHETPATAPTPVEPAPAEETKETK